MQPPAGRFEFPEATAVSLGGVRRIGWIGILSAVPCAGFALRAGEVLASIGFAAFALLGLFLLVAASARYAADHEALYAITMLGRRLRMPWARVQRVEIGTGGAVVFSGADARFVLPPPALWSGPHKAALVQMIQGQVQRLGVRPLTSRSADCRISRNVRVPGKNGAP
jgi:hypothetical protein